MTCPTEVEAPFNRARISPERLPIRTTSVRTDNVLT